VEIWYNKRAMIKRKAILVTLIAVVFLYAAYYIVLRFTSPMHDFHDQINLGALFMMSFLLMIYGVELKSKKLYSAAAILMMYAVFEFLQQQFGLYEDGVIINKPLDALYHFINSMALAVVAFSIYTQIILHQKIAQITSAAYDQTEAIFIEYFKKTGKIKIEFSAQFQKKYELNYKEYESTLNDFKEFVHPEDQQIFTYFQTFTQGTKTTSAIFRVKLPLMELYVFLFVRGSYTLEQRYVFVGFDVTEFEMTQRSLEAKKVQYDLLETESKQIIASTQTLIVKVDVHGKIVFASESFIKIFGGSERNVIGESIFKIYQLKNRHDFPWFDEAIANYTSSDQSIITIKNEKKYISWKNDVLFDANGKVEFVVSVGQDITDIIELNQRLDFQSKHDALTGLLDYKGLFDTIQTMENVSVAICFFIELRNYSLIASYYGNEISDALIQQVAKEYSSIQEYNYLIARYSSNQFVYLALNPTATDLNNLVQSFQKGIFKVYDVLNVAVQTKKNIGYAQYPKDTNDLTKLISLSILAMRESSAQEHNTIFKYEEKMSEQLVQNVSLAYELYQAILNSKIEVHFQHIVDASSGEIVYIESLARWNDKEKGSIPPEIFLSIAKQSDLIDILDEYLAKKAIFEFAEIHKRDLYKHTKLTLNLSPGTFLRDDFIYILNAYVEKKHVKMTDIVIEVSENTFVHGFDLCNEFIKKYKEYGYLIAIDDFGSHFSSLSILDSINYDLIKIDGAFILNMESEKNSIIVQMIIKIANLDGKRVIAEAVETKEICDELIKFNCLLHQGYYFHRPEKL
jgi:PAS domain S-box-containing protein